MPVRILIIDDDQGDVGRTRALLQEGMREPFEVEWADGFAAGRARLMDDTFDVALLDYRLGVATGVDLLDDVGFASSKVPIIILTGVVDQALDLAVMQAGAADYLQKDRLDATALEKAIRYAVQGRRLEQQRARLVREKAARRAAEAANHAKDNFLALLSHELRTPLNAISNWVQLLELDDAHDIDPETLGEAIEAIGRNVRLQAQLVDDLLDVSRIVAGKLELKRERVDLSAVCGEALEGCQTLAAIKRITIDTDITPREPLGEFYGDPTRLQQIVWNLANNAVKFTQEGGTLAVSVDVADQNVTITVADNGPGIRADDLPFIFDRFRQGSGTEEPSGRPGGLGIGLALVRHLVELHGGTVEAQSTTDGPDHGSTFTVTLPRHGMPETIVAQQP